MASEACAAPVAMITLVAADRQWFKARVGFDEPETPLDRSICVHALAEKAVLVIPDLTRDRRTRANRSVTGPSAFRFYAGAPLRSPCGHGLGTLCVIDREPRAEGLTVPQAGLLRALGEQAMALFEARRALRVQREESERLRANEAFLHGVLAASPDCIKVLDLDGRLDFMNGPGLRVMEVDDFARIAGTSWPRFWKGPAEAEARRAVATAGGGRRGAFRGMGRDPARRPEAVGGVGYAHPRANGTPGTPARGLARPDGGKAGGGAAGRPDEPRRQCA